MHVESLKVPIHVTNAPTTYMLKIEAILCGNKTETFAFESKGCDLVMFDQTVYLKNINIHNIQSLQVNIKVSMKTKRLCFLKKKILVGKACVTFEDRRVSSIMHVTKVLSRKNNWDFKCFVAEHWRSWNILFFHKLAINMHSVSISLRKCIISLFN